MQAPAIVGMMFVVDSAKVKALPTNKRFGLYVIGLSSYYFYHHLSKAVAWHVSFRAVEPIIERTFSDLSQEDLLLLKDLSPTQKSSLPS